MLDNLLYGRHFVLPAYSTRKVKFPVVQKKKNWKSSPEPQNLREIVISIYRKTNAISSLIRHKEN